MPVTPGKNSSNNGKRKQTPPPLSKKNYVKFKGETSKILKAELLKKRIRLLWKIIQIIYSLVYIW